MVPQAPPNSAWHEFCVNAGMAKRRIPIKYIPNTVSVPVRTTPVSKAA